MTSNKFEELNPQEEMGGKENSLTTKPIIVPFKTIFQKRNCVLQNLNRKSRKISVECELLTQDHNRRDIVKIRGKYLQQMVRSDMKHFINYIIPRIGNSNATLNTGNCKQ